MNTTSTLDRITRLYTLGPTGTNCEQAAHEWFRRAGRSGDVYLHDTLEDALEEMPATDDVALLGCAVYPELHTLVFANLHRLAIAGSFIVPTHHMVLAIAGHDAPTTVATHPAPQKLAPPHLARLLVNSNARAAAICAEGAADSCITTLPAAERYGLIVLRDFGPVPMDFTLHLPILTR